jgi:hypothetical protein
MHTWLTARGSPEDHIKTLVDENATGQAIIKMFESHLIENPSITRDAPILIYYAGHGGHDERVEQAGDNPFNELIVPYDALDYFDDVSVDLNLAISGLTMTTLLRRLAHMRGQNVTIILDCQRDDGTSQTLVSLRDAERQRSNSRKS